VEKSDTDPSAAASSSNVLSGAGAGGSSSSGGGGPRRASANTTASPTPSGAATTSAAAAAAAAAGADRPGSELRRKGDAGTSIPKIIPATVTEIAAEVYASFWACHLRNGNDSFPFVAHKALNKKRVLYKRQNDMKSKGIVDFYTTAAATDNLHVRLFGRLLGLPLRGTPPYSQGTGNWVRPACGHVATLILAAAYCDNLNHQRERDRVLKEEDMSAEEGLPETNQLFHGDSSLPAPWGTGRRNDGTATGTATGADATSASEPQTPLISTGVNSRLQTGASETEKTKLLSSLGTTALLSVNAVDKSQPPSATEFRKRLMRFYSSGAVASQAAKVIPLRRGIEILQSLSKASEPHWALNPLVPRCLEYHLTCPWGPDSVARLLRALVTAAAAAAPVGTATLQRTRRLSHIRSNTALSPSRQAGNVPATAAATPNQRKPKEISFAANDPTAGAASPDDKAKADLLQAIQTAVSMTSSPGGGGGGGGRDEATALTYESAMALADAEGLSITIEEFVLVALDQWDWECARLYSEIERIATQGPRRAAISKVRNRFSCP